MLKVLLVEDENLIRRGLQYKMDWTEVNCVVVGEAATGQEGLTQIKALRPDIVITDIRMPDMDGLEMLREGRAVCPFHAIIISGYGEFDYAQQAIRLGVAEYLLKPVDVNELKNCLRRIAAGAPDGQSGETPEPDEKPAPLQNKYAEAMMQYIRQHYATIFSITTAFGAPWSCRSAASASSTRSRSWWVFPITSISTRSIRSIPAILPT